MVNLNLLRRFAVVTLLVMALVGCNMPRNTQVPTPTLSPIPVNTCNENELSPSGVLRSTDHGATWTSLGRICMHDSSILSVDFTAIPWNGGVALYFIDMKLLNQPASVQRILYRAISMDGVNFDKPQPVVTAPVDMFDLAVIRMPDGKVRLYVPITDIPLNMGVASFISDDGLHFIRESGTRAANGSMPGALVLVDGRVRIFTGGMDSSNQPGIISFISNDGLNFTMESGLRVAAAGRKQTEMTSDSSPIALHDGGYMMAFMINPTDPPDAIKAQYYLATSDDGFTWTVNPTFFVEGGTSCLVETADGTLFFYYGQ